ncbi:hypothetical protein F4821DRAFT_250064 [Hypoxylon rubiginosum]|uniref:Uncharacterized protein n=1 Tax=Hypoxylon rubiginosum TaxID=110542 RepID=A0ACC0CL57_9PEZI|nr:hypothetical protein F4821DRAFT_250064 [Hypoxylon rubiginosum]
MAGIDDIELEGVGGAGNISVRSDRCFRDYSPSDTIVSLSSSDDGQAFFSRPVPAFIHRSQSPSTPSLPVKNDDGASNGRPSTIPYHNVLKTEQAAPPCLADLSHPLAKFRYETQSHEQLALGISPAEFGDLAVLVNSPLLPTNHTWQSSGASSSQLLSSDHPPAVQLTSMNDISPATELRDLLHVIEAPGWKDDVPLEEQVQFLLRATKLKRRVRSETYPRESRMPKVRRRNCSRKYGGGP